MDEKEFFVVHGLRTIGFCSAVERHCSSSPVLSYAAHTVLPTLPTLAADSFSFCLVRHTRSLCKRRAFVSLSILFPSVCTFCVRESTRRCSSSVKMNPESLKSLCLDYVSRNIDGYFAKKNGEPGSVPGFVNGPAFLPEELSESLLTKINLSNKLDDKVLALFNDKNVRLRYVRCYCV